MLSNHSVPARTERTNEGSGPRPRRWRTALSAGLMTIVLASLAQGTPTLNSVLTASCPTTTLGNFEIDGNLTVECPPAIDWGSLTPNSTLAMVPNVAVGVDKLSGTTDNSFGQGAKEDGSTVQVVTGSIPPNKNDLTRFNVSDQFISGKPFLYLAWERLVNIGSADMDFEFNQATQTLTAATTGSVTINRTVGDLLILFEFSGSGSPTLQYAKWTAGGVWSTPTTIPASQALGAVNAGSVTDPLQPGSPTLTAGLFGEAAIDLSAAGVFNSSSCTNFGSAFVKSRSSGSSFDSELKDFIAPVPVDLTNCQPTTVTLKKVDNSGNALAGAVMQLVKDADGDGLPLDAADAPEIAPDNPTAGTSDCTTGTNGIGNCVYTFSSPTQAATYIGHEKTPPAGYTAAPDQATAVSVGLTAQSITLTYIDTPLPGTINILKTDDSSPGLPLQGAGFTLLVDAAPSGGSPGPEDTKATGVGTNPCTTSASGTCSFTPVPLGHYWVVETTTPQGHATASPAYLPVVIGAVAGGDTEHVVFVNPVRASIRVLKTDDSQPANLLSGAIFQLQQAGITLQTCTTDPTGYCTFADQVGQGTYTIHESLTPPGHGPAPDQTATITAAKAGQTVTYSFVDPVLASIQVTKVDDSQPANPLSGATFQLQQPAGTTLQSCTTGAAGTCTFTNEVGLGTYTIHEAIPPSGYATAADQIATITAANAGLTVPFTFVDPVRATIQVLKVDDAPTPNHLSGASFQLRQSGTTLQTCTTDATGYCSFTSVGQGTYTIHESVTPVGYVTAPDQTATVTAGSAGQTLSYTFVDPRQFRIIAIVCQEGASNTLYPSQVTVDGVTLPSIGSAPPGVSVATLCSLGGAEFDHLRAGTHASSFRME